MLKAKECYANEEAYRSALFMHMGDIPCYSLDPILGTQVKFIINNDDTKKFGAARESRFFFLSRDGKSKAFYKADAKAMLNTISFIRDKRVQNYTDQLIYSSTERVKNAGQTLSVMMGQFQERIIDAVHQNPRDFEIEDYRTIKFERLITRLESILNEFIIMSDGGLIAGCGVPYHSTEGASTLLPLNNRISSYSSPIFLRLVKTPYGVNHIMMYSKNKSLIWYELNKESTSTLSEIIEGYINAMETLIEEFNDLKEDHDSFVKAHPVTLSEDREHFMEYVGVRGTYGAQRDDLGQGMIINLNSDATPAMSKTYFHYHPEFMKDLYAGLRFLVNFYK